jgi:polysaccharide export outer membrane protein
MTLFPRTRTIAAMAALLAGLCSPQATLLAADERVTYRLGPDDQLVIRVQDVEEVPDRPFRVDARGWINVPLIGRLQAAGMSVEELESNLSERFARYLRDPEVTVFIAEYRSQPVSVLGAVRNPGVHQIRGPKTLYETLSLAGGLSQDAGNVIRITRRRSAGPLPLRNVTADTSGDFSVGEISVRSVLEANNPQQNIGVLPDDVISVPKAELVYVIGAVRRSGGFVLNEKEQISVLQALALAEGLDRTAASGRARILRASASGEKRQELPVNLKDVMGARASDVPLLPNDILFVPTSGPKSAIGRGVEAAITLGTGIAIYRR